MGIKKTIIYILAALAFYVLISMPLLGLITYGILGVEPTFLSWLIHFGITIFLYTTVVGPWLRNKLMKR